MSPANTVLPALADINVPRHVRIQVVNDFESLMAEIGRKSMAGYAGSAFFGTAFIQGNRLQFTTAMPVEKMLAVSKMDRSKKKDNITEVTQHANRPVEPPHARAIRQYLMTTACSGDLFILPSFTFNYGVELTDEDPVAVLVVFGSTDDSMNAWPAMFLLPAGAKLDTTDGAHRRSQIEDILSGSKATVEQKDALRRNAVDVKIVFEANRNHSHQDFADCGRAKSIAKSIIAGFDIRDARNSRTRQLVERVPFLRNYVDATANNVNLSAKSRMVWSLSAVRGFVGHCDNFHPDESLTRVAEKTTDAEKFFDEIVKHLPQLKALDAARHERSPEISTGALRERRGGDIMLRGIGMSILARAYLYCIEHHVTFSHMAQKLAAVDWHVLKIERAALPQSEGEEYRDAVYANANPLWSNALVVGEGHYRISSSFEVADASWAKVVAEHLANERAAA
jgi:hypothetical protein